MYRPHKLTQKNCTHIVQNSRCEFNQFNSRLENTNFTMCTTDNPLINEFKNKFIIQNNKRLKIATQILFGLTKDYSI